MLARTAVPLAMGAQRTRLLPSLIPSFGARPSPAQSAQSHTTKTNNKERLMKRMFHTLAAAFLICLQAWACDLPAWNDDSGMVLRSEFVNAGAGEQRTNLTVA